MAALNVDGLIAALAIAFWVIRRVVKSRQTDAQKPSGPSSGPFRPSERIEVEEEAPPLFSQEMHGTDVQEMRHSSDAPLDRMSDEMPAPSPMMAERKDSPPSHMKPATPEPPEEDAGAQSAHDSAPRRGYPIDFHPQTLRQMIILTEILGKPKSLR